MYVIEIVFLMTPCAAEEILLENVELILEAFDYLQLPFALKSGIDFLMPLQCFPVCQSLHCCKVLVLLCCFAGRIGKLSIRIPWKKLGWDPIIFVIEDVFVCACPREDSEACH